jgi:diguanylate cyclase (GGDEF)-like protein
LKERSEDRMSWTAIVAANAALLGAYTAAVWRYAQRRMSTSEARAPEESREHGLPHDELTKLPDRTLFGERLERALARSVRRREACAVLSIDLDRFARISNGLGPSAGDRLLRQVAARLDSVVRPEDTVARTGGDEFMVLLEAVRGMGQAIAVAERIEAAFRRPIDADGRELLVTMSIGIALGRGGRDRPEDVLQNAEVAVHRAKESGGARYEVFRQEMTPHPLERLGLESDLRHAVDRGEFGLEYQPTVELSSGRIAGVEALVRWAHPERGSLPGPEFMPVAEETGLILSVGRWALREACATAAAWAHGRAEPLVVCASLSPRQLQQPRLRVVDEVSAALANAGLAPEALCLEIPEAAVTEQLEAVVTTMCDLKGLGVRLALDDFGGGYFPLSRLRRLPLDTVRMDPSLTAEAGEGPEGEAIVRALIDLCHATGTRVLAKGLYDRAQIRLLKGLGCDLGQGSCLLPPLPPDDIGRMTDRREPTAAGEQPRG